MNIEFKWWKAIGMFLLIVGWTALFIIERPIPYNPIPSFIWIGLGIIFLSVERKPTKHNSS